MDMMIPVLYCLSTYLVLQTKLMMALCVTAEFTPRDPKTVVSRSVVYWLVCTVLMLVAAILDYTYKTFIITQIQLIAVWIFALVWRLLFFRETMVSKLFSLFCTVILLLAGNAFCNLVDAVSTEFDFGTLPWLLENDTNLLVDVIIAIRELAVYSVVWYAAFLVCRHVLDGKWVSIVNKPTAVLYAFLMLMACGLFVIEVNAPQYSFLFFFMIFCGEFAFGVLSMIIVVVLDLRARAEKQRAQAETELALTQKLWDLEKKQYDFIKDNIEIINIKCHDMRHYINGMNSDSPAIRQEMTAMSEAIDAYDGRIQTGNPVCDITLTDKSLECMSKGIDFICIVDGMALHFIDEVSLYSLLGNAIENAIQHVERFDDSEKRLITLNVSRKDNMVVINVENLLEGELVLEDGLPQSGAHETGWHGFGMRSMRSIAERYGGGLEVSVEDGIFRLIIVLPYKEKQK